MSEPVKLEATESGIQFVGVEENSGEAEFQLTLANDEVEMKGGVFLSDTLWQAMTERISAARRSMGNEGQEINGVLPSRVNDAEYVIVENSKTVLVHGCVGVVVLASSEVDVCKRTNRFVKGTRDAMLELDATKTDLDYAQAAAHDASQQVLALREGVLEAIKSLSSVDFDHNPEEIGAEVNEALRELLQKGVENEKTYSKRPD